MELSEIKSRLSIFQVLNHYGLKPNKHGFILCPFHDDHSPSLKVYPKTNTFHCFGCGKSGDVIEFIQLKKNAPSTRQF
jgi:DNA primase